MADVALTQGSLSSECLRRLCELDIVPSLICLETHYDRFISLISFSDQFLICCLTKSFSFQNIDGL